MFSTTVISCVFWFSEECHVNVIQEMDIPQVNVLETEELFEMGPSMGIVSNDTVGLNTFVLEPETDYDSYFGIDLQAVIQGFFFAPETNVYDDNQVNQVYATQFWPSEQPSQQDDADVRMAQEYFKEMMSGDQQPSTPYEQDDIDVRMAQQYFEEMLSERQQRTTTTSSGILSEFDRYDGQTCSLGKHEPLATFELSVTDNDVDPSPCARACLAVSSCSGFQILQLRALTYCDLLSTCTEDRLQVVPSDSLSTFLLNTDNDITRSPFFDYYYQYEDVGGYFIPLMLLFTILCCAIAACRIQRRRRLLAARAAALRREMMRSRRLDTDKGKLESDSEVIVVGHEVEPLPPPSSPRRKASVEGHVYQEF